MKQMEEKLRVANISKDELQSHHNQQQTLISELTSKNSSLTLEVESYKRRIEELSEVCTCTRFYVIEKCVKKCIFVSCSSYRLLWLNLLHI